MYVCMYVCMYVVYGAPASRSLAAPRQSAATSWSATIHVHYYYCTMVIILYTYIIIWLYYITMYYIL